MPVTRPGITVRLSNLIVLQVLFIFAALALIVFAPGTGPNVDRETAKVEARLVMLADGVQSLLDQPSRQQEGIFTDLSLLLSGDDMVERAALVRVADSHKLQLEGVFVASEGGKWTAEGEIAAAGLYDPKVLMAVASQQNTAEYRITLGAHHLTMYSRVTGDEAKTGLVLVLEGDHGLTVAPRSNLQYAILVLFLSATLISLLTIHLVSKRFRQPLERLIRGFEKTAGGELFYLMEYEGDRELGQLTSAYNAMAQKLWDSQKRLKAYTTRIRQSNLKTLESQLFLSTLIDTSPLIIVVADRDGQIMIFNRSASEVFGFTSEEMVGKPLSSLIKDGPQDEIGPSDQRAAKVEFEMICRRKDDELFPVYVVASDVAADGSAPVARLYVCRDISESKSFQDMMVRLDRYCTRGEMAGDIAHEINNYLAVLMGNVELLPILMKKGKQEKIDHKLEVMKTTVERIARFANGLMDVPQDEVALELCSINQVVENVIAFLKPQNKFDATVFLTELSTGVPLLHVDQGQIQQLLVNLIYNAADALAGCEGEKQIRVITSLGDLEGERCACVEVWDNGPGVPENKQELLFKDRFSTKRKGHGIGLVTCRKIVENHQGTISYRTDSGAHFEVRLPTDVTAAASRITDAETHSQPV